MIFFFFFRPPFFTLPAFFPAFRRPAIRGRICRFRRRFLPAKLFFATLREPPRRRRLFPAPCRAAAIFFFFARNSTKRWAFRF